MQIEKQMLLFFIAFIEIFFLIYNFQIIHAQCWNGNIQKGRRCTDVFKSVATSSRKKCLAVCLQTIGCCSVNFNKHEKSCEMCSNKEDQKIVKESMYSYIGNVEIVTNCGTLNTFQPFCVNCLGPHPTLYKAAANTDLSAGYPVIRYTCTEGYVSDGGTTTSTCDVTTKQWSMPSMKCKVPCESSPPYFQNAETTFDTFANNAVYIYSCSSGYINSGESAVSVCDIPSKQWSKPSVSCIVCFENKFTFNKSISTTQGNRQCRRWDDPGSRFASYNNSYFEADGYSKSKASNYCRHPRLEDKDVLYFSMPGVFCVTTDTPQRLLCSIPNCSSADVQTCGDPPKLNTTQTSRSFPVAADVFIATYKCLAYRNSKSSTPHCPVSRCTGLNNWTTPSYSCSTKDCISGGDFASYSGKRFCTDSGRICQSWTSKEPHVPVYALAASDENYCRPAGGFKPWCYTTDKQLRWEFCTLPEC